jgi:hypothetical protein
MRAQEPDDRRRQCAGPDLRNVDRQRGEAAARAVLLEVVLELGLSRGEDRECRGSQPDTTLRLACATLAVQQSTTGTFFAASAAICDANSVSGWDDVTTALGGFATS